MTVRSRQREVGYLAARQSEAPTRARISGGNPTEVQGIDNRQATNLLADRKTPERHWRLGDYRFGAGAAVFRQCALDRVADQRPATHGARRAAVWPRSSTCGSCWPSASSSRHGATCRPCAIYWGRGVKSREHAARACGAVLSSRGREFYEFSCCLSGCFSCSGYFLAGKTGRNRGRKGPEYGQTAAEQGTSWPIPCESLAARHGATSPLTASGQRQVWAGRW
jgi:hypothetical protein